MNEEKPKKKQLIGTIVGSVVAVCAYFLVSTMLSSSSNFDDVLAQTASDLNKTCPMLVDEYTRLDNAVALPNKTFQYNYTLVKNTIDEVNVEDIASMKGQFTNVIKTNPDMKHFRDNNVTINYNYTDKEGVFITKISITPEEYK